MTKLDDCPLSGSLVTITLAGDLNRPRTFRYQTSTKDGVFVSPTNRDTLQFLPWHQIASFEATPPETGRPGNRWGR